MKKRLISVLLAVSVLFTAAAINISAAAPTLYEITNAAIAIICANEGAYKSVRADDNGALSVGCLQWHANRALNLLRTIVAANPTNAKTVLGAALYNEITNTATSWVSRIPNESETALLIRLLDTPESKKAQDDLRYNDISAYINHGGALGIASPSALVYFADIENQCGGGGSARILAAAQKTAGGIVGLTALHNAALADSAAGKFPTRRNKVYNYALTLGWESSGESYDIWRTDFDVKIRSGPGTQYTHLTTAGAGTLLAIYETQEVDGALWGRMPVGWLCLDYCTNISNPTKISFIFDAAGGELDSERTASLTVNGMNRTRGANELIVFTAAWGATTGTNKYGREVSVDANGIVTQFNPYGVGDTEIPAGGFVVSGHDLGSTALESNITIGCFVYFDASEMKLDIYSSRGAYLAATKDAEKGKAVGELPVPVRKGYDFAGWYDAGTPVTSETVFSRAGEITLTAMWTPATVELTLDAQNGEVDARENPGRKLDGINVGRGGNMLIAYTPERGATTITNIYGSEAIIDSDGTVTYMTPYGVCNSAIPAGGMVLSGNDLGSDWLRDNLTVGDRVSFDRVTMQLTVTQAAGEKLARYGGVIGWLPTATRPGFSFTGWYTEPECLNKVSMWDTSAFAEDAALYAGWAVSTATVSFDAAGGEGAPSEIVFNSGEAVALPAAKPTRTCHTFIGWADSAGATVPLYQPGDIYSGGTATLYALWINKHDVNENCEINLIGTDGTNIRYSYECLLCGYSGVLLRSPSSSSAQLSVKAKVQEEGKIKATLSFSGADMKSLSFRLNYSDELTLASFAPATAGVSLTGGTGYLTVTCNTVTAGGLLEIVFDADLPRLDALSVSELFGTVSDAANPRLVIPAYLTSSVHMSGADSDMQPVVPGDIDGDGRVNSSDVMMIKALLLAGDGYEMFRPDVDGDGKVNVTDVMMIKLYILRVL